MPKVKDKVKSAMKRAKAKRVNVPPDAVLHEANQEFDPPVKAPGKAANWKEFEVQSLMMACNAKRDVIKGSWRSPSGGVYNREKAWVAVAEYVNKVAVEKRTIKQCQHKLGDLIVLTKEKHRVLKAKLEKTGSEPVEQKFFLTRGEEMVLDYIGEEAVLGIAGIKATPLVHSVKVREGQDIKAWSKARATKMNYKYVFDD